MLIYKISSPNTDLVYVGETNQTLGRRFGKHHSSYKAWLAGKPKASYCTSYKVLEHGDARIELIEESDDEDYWINAIPNTCNERRGLFDRAAYYRAYREENKEEISARMKVYREENKEEINAQNSAYYAENKDEINARRRQREPCPKCGRVVRRGGMASHQRTKVCQNHAV
jgi:ribosomal protein S27AE